MHNSHQARPKIKFHLDQNAHDLIRVAAAMRRTSVAAFVRQAAISEADRIRADPRFAERGLPAPKHLETI